MSNDNDDDDDLEVYIYRGNSRGEVIPQSVEKLIVNEGIIKFPSRMCEDFSDLQIVALPNGLTDIGKFTFAHCRNLLEISICNTVRLIGRSAFKECENLTNVNFFECSTSSSSYSKSYELRFGTGVFRDCTSLQRIRLPSSLSQFGKSACNGCSSLVEANLSTTSVTEISVEAFYGCSSLQTVSLPNTLKWIRDYAFSGCTGLVTVIVPLDSPSINIGDASFNDCSQLAVLALPKDATAQGYSSFYDCDLLQEMYGEMEWHGGCRDVHVVRGLQRRFQNLPIHRMCYDHSAIAVQEFRQSIADQQQQQQEISLVDDFGMTPFHILFSTSDPRGDLLKVLLETLPNQILNWKDANGRRPLDYLIDNWADRASSTLLQMTFQKWMICRLAHWGATSWVDTMQTKIRGILLVENDNERRAVLYKEARSLLDHYENVETVSILEMTLWKWKLKDHGSGPLDREETRFLSGSNIVIPNVTLFLGIPRTSV